MRMKLRIAVLFAALILLLAGCGGGDDDGGGVTPTPTNKVAVPTPTTEAPSATPMEEISPTPEATPTEAATPTPEPTAEPTPTETPEPTPTEEPDPTLEATPTVDPTISPEATPTPTPIVGDSYKLTGLVYAYRATAIYQDPTTASRKLDDVEAGEFLAIELDESVFGSDEWYMVQYRRDVFGYLPREGVTEAIPANAVTYGNKKFAASDWTSLSNWIRDTYWEEMSYGEDDGYTTEHVADDDAAIAQYRKKFKFADGRTNRMYPQLTYVPIAEMKLYVNVFVEEQDFFACGYDENGELVYMRKFILTEEGAAPGDSLRRATVADGTIVTEYEFAETGDNRVLVFESDGRIETALVYRYTDNITHGAPFCRLDMEYDKNGRRTNAILTIRNDETHRYNTFFEYDANGKLIRMIEMTCRTADDVWTVRYGVQAVRK